MSRTTKAKAWAALVIQGVGQALTLGVLHAEAVLSAATIYGVYQTPNRPVSPRV